MSSINKGFVAFCIPLLTLLALSGCEDPGSVGGEFVDKSNPVVNTFQITSTQAQSFQGYTGRLNYISFGAYADPLLGNIEAVAMLKPTINGVDLPTKESFIDNYIMKLQLQLDSLNTYGDTLNTGIYSVYEINTQWNGVNFKMGGPKVYDETSAKIGSFPVGDAKNIVINLSDEWKREYANIFYNNASNADSLFQYGFNGLALVANDGTDKISFINATASKFLAVNVNAPDTSVIDIKDWAYTLNRTDTTYQSELSPLHSTTSGMLKMNLNSYIEEFEDKNFIKAEVVLYEATELLENSLSDNHTRVNISSLNMDIGYESDPAYEFQFGAVEILGSRKSSDNSFRFNVTDYLNNYIFGSENREDLYIGIGSSSGQLRSTLIYNETAPEHLRPKLIITSIEDGEQ